MVAKVSAAQVTAVPLTMACWYRPTSGINSYLMCIGASATVNAFEMFCANNGVNGTYTAQATAASLLNSSVSAAVSNNPGVWHHIVGVFASATAVTVWVDGVAATTATTSRVPSGLNQYTIGARDRGGAQNNYANGRIGLPTIWNVGLTTNEIVALSRGANPLGVRRASIVHCAPNCDQNVIGASSLTLTGSPPLADNPPVTPFSRRWWQASNLIIPDGSTGLTRSRGFFAGNPF